MLAVFSLLLDSIPSPSGECDSSAFRCIALNRQANHPTNHQSLITNTSWSPSSYYSPRSPFRGG